MAESDEIGEVLVDFGMWLSDPETRARRAADLAEDGATASEILAVCEFTERGAAHDLALTGARLAQLLRPGVWQDSLKAAEALQERLQSTRWGKADPGATLRDEDNSEAHRGLLGEGARTAMLAWERVFHEQRMPAAVEAELQVNSAALCELLAQGATIYGVEEPAKVAELLMAGQWSQVRALITAQP